jgi:PAS domain-containing protein
MLDPNRYFKSEDIRLARTLASQAAISIENARLQTETRRTVEELYVINDMSMALSSATNLDQLLAVVADQLPNLTEAEGIYVALYDSAAGVISFPLALFRDQPLGWPERPLGKDEFSMIQAAGPAATGENLTSAAQPGIETLMPEARCFLGVPLFAADELIACWRCATTTRWPATATNASQHRRCAAMATQSHACSSKRCNWPKNSGMRACAPSNWNKSATTSARCTASPPAATSLDVERLLNRALEMVAGCRRDTGAIPSRRAELRAVLFRRTSQAAGSSPAKKPPRCAWMKDWLGGAQQAERDVDNVGRTAVGPPDQSGCPAARRAGCADRVQRRRARRMMLYTKARRVPRRPLRLVTAAASQVANAMNNAELYSLIRDQAERLGSMLRQEQVEATKSASILESVADGVMVADADGQVIVFNSTAERILDIPSSRVLNRPTSELAGLYGKGGTRWAEEMDQWMRDPASYQAGEFLEERITLDDERIISVRLSPVHMRDQFLGTVSVFRDITRDVGGPAQE